LGTQAKAIVGAGTGAMAHGHWQRLAAAARLPSSAFAAAGEANANSSRWP